MGCEFMGTSIRRVWVDPATGELRTDTIDSVTIYTHYVGPVAEPRRHAQEPYYRKFERKKNEDD